MRVAKGGIIFGVIIWSAASMAQAGMKDALPLGVEHFSCGSFVFTVKGGTLVEDQTGDIYRIVQNNRYGIVATNSMSEFAPKLQKVVVAFFSLAVERSTGQALWAEGEAGRPPESAIQLTCEAL